MKDKTRAVRRAHRERLIKKIMNYEIIRWWDFKEDTVERRRERATLYFNHIKTCSCFMCGNERHNSWATKGGRMTIQERRSEESFNDQMKEIALIPEEKDYILEVKDEGHWKVGRLFCNIFIESEDFTHDARLTLTGDFETVQQELDYAQMIADRLNGK